MKKWFSEIACQRHRGHDKRYALRLISHNEHPYFHLFWDDNSIKPIINFVPFYSASLFTNHWIHFSVTWWWFKWKHFPRYWPFVRGIHRSPVNSPHKGHWRGALIFSLICVWISGWVNNLEAGDLRRYYAHYDVIVMKFGQCARIDIKHVIFLHALGNYCQAGYTITLSILSFLSFEVFTVD